MGADIVADIERLLPDCGLYRTTLPLPGNEEAMPAGSLAYFHNHSTAGPPEVLAADHNVLNRWHFHGPGLPVRHLAWSRTLQRLPDQGFYLLREALAFDGGSWPAGSLVQLGYTRTADAILFIAQVRRKLEENVLWFSDRGVGLPRERLGILEPVSVYEEPRREGSGDAGPDHT
jgi:hypothetical protein